MISSTINLSLQGTTAAQPRAQISCTQEALPYAFCSTIPAPAIPAHRRRGSTPKARQSPQGRAAARAGFGSPPPGCCRHPHQPCGSPGTADAGAHPQPSTPLTRPQRRAAAADRRWPRRQPWHSEDRRRRPQRLACFTFCGAKTASCGCWNCGVHRISRRFNCAYGRLNSASLLLH